MPYAAQSDLDRAVNSRAISTLSGTDKDWALAAASALMDGYFRSRFGAPLTTFGADTTMHCASIAVWYLMKERGFRPEDGSDQTIRMAYDDALLWLRDVANQKVTPAAAPQLAAPGGGQAWTSSKSGWRV